jgi:general secretion pathway protein K
MRRRAARGVALVQALVVVAALAAVAAALLARARSATEVLGLRATAAQVQAYLDAGLEQALAELAPQMAEGVLRPGQGWDRPRRVEIGEGGRVGWQVTDLQGRFNLAWLDDPTEPGATAAAAFALLAREAGLAPGLADRLLRAAGPDPDARARAFAPAPAPDMPLRLLAQLAGVEGGAAGTAALAPLVAALPAEARFNPLTAPLPVVGALLPGLSAPELAAFDIARRGGQIGQAQDLPGWATGRWPDSALVALDGLRLGSEPAWLELRLTAERDGLRLGRVVILTSEPGLAGLGGLRPWLSLPAPP